MASPHAAGVAALLLALNPDLQGPEVREAVRRAARVDALTGEVPNSRIGYGKLRALEAASLGISIVTGLAASPGGGFAASDNPFVDSYNIYRGTIPGISTANYGACLMNGLPSREFADPDWPFAGQAFFYLATGVRAGIGGFIGIDSDGLVRPNNAPCL